jgi:uncharacterized protein YpbB
MKKTKTKKKPVNEQLTKTLPATRVTEATYNRILQRMAEEKRRRISEVVRLTLEDHFEEATA